MDHLTKILQKRLALDDSNKQKSTASSARRIGPPLPGTTRTTGVGGTSKADEYLTSTEVKSILAGDLTSRKIVYLIEGMSKASDLVIPDIVLSQGVARLATKPSLVPMSLALRYGANPNLYIDVPKLGSVHILVFVISALRNEGGAGVSTDRSLVYSAVYTLLVSGANPTLPPRSSSRGIAEVTTAEEMLTQGSVIEWVTAKQIDFPLKEWFEIIDGVKDPKTEEDRLGLKAIRIRGAVLLDRYDLLEASDIIDEFDPIKYHANTIFSRLIKAGSLRRKNEDLRRSIDYLNLGSFTDLVNDGVIPSYPTWEIGKPSFTNGYNTINSLLLVMQASKDDPIVSNLLLKMLVEALKNNGVFDSEQLAMLRRINSKAAEQAIKAYSAPFWSKECRVAEAPSSPRLVNLASNLSLDVTMSKRVVCRKLKSISEVDAKSLKAAAITRQRSRLAADTSEIIDYVDDTPSASCINTTDINPEEYADLDVVFYKDGRNMTWCFTREDYDNLLSTGVNPTTREKLPESLLAKIRYKKDQIKGIGISDLDAMTIDESIKLLMAEDTVSSSQSNKILDEVLAAIGIDRKNFDKFTNNQLENFSAMTGNRIRLKGLSKKHAQFTFARGVAPIVLRDKAYANLILTAMAK
uniref:Uncharacterized protein n=1 Tax=Pithovirus LCPAC103 TaxID=2506588 RepID=A0A481Z3A4_9VIRU|nr:MAG: hypothetical protein LCPAC103_00050 [Pithovirus LCPAC103]